MPRCSTSLRTVPGVTRNNGESFTPLVPVGTGVLQTANEVVPPCATDSEFDGSTTPCEARVDYVEPDTIAATDPSASAIPSHGVGGAPCAATSGASGFGWGAGDETPLLIQVLV
ncbi:hypothetical protein V6N13_003179 [Hibiscus sabdariffa]